MSQGFRPAKPKGAPFSAVPTAAPLWALTRPPWCGWDGRSGVRRPRTSLETSLFSLAWPLKGLIGIGMGPNTRCGSSGQRAGDQRRSLRHARSRFLARPFTAGHFLTRTQSGFVRFGNLRESRRRIVIIRRIVIMLCARFRARWNTTDMGNVPGKSDEFRPNRRAKTIC